MKVVFITLITVSFLLGIIQTSQVFADEQQDEIFPGNNERHLSEAAIYRFELDNDILFSSDNQFTNGWSFQVHTPVADNWHNIEGPAEFLKEFGAWLPSLSAEDLKYRMSLSIGQIMQTPDDLTDPNLITDDVPYAGVMTIKSTWTAYNDIEFRGFEIVFGVLGRPSMAEQSQNFVHNLTDSIIAEGWDNQLKTEPVFNVNYMRKKKFYKAGRADGLSFDAVLNGDIQLGTLLTSAGASIELRFGSNMPRGFAYRADPVGRYLTYNATLAPANPKQSSIYGTLIVGGTYFAHNLLLDGNVFRDAVHSVEKEDLVGIATLGLHYERQSWAIHFDLFFTTDTIDTSKVTGNPDADNSFGAFTFEWRI